MTPGSAEVPLVVLRHGATAWNEAKRIQGRSDQPLSESGRRQVGAWRLPSAFERYAWLTSPLHRGEGDRGPARGMLRPERSPP